MANNSNLSKRAALRQAQEMEERNKRNKRILGFGFGLVGLVVVVVLAIVIVQAVGNRVTVAEEQLTPPNATENFGVLMSDKEPSEDTPHLIIWEDFQCPSCAAAHASLGPVIDQLVADGDITAEIRVASFMDREREDGPSLRGAVAAAAAKEVGKFEDFHRVIFNFQDTGYTDQVLRNDVPEAAGITGEDLARYTELYNTRAFNDWAEKTGQKFYDDGVDATPTYVVSGKRLDLGSVEATASGMLGAITAAWEAGGKQIEDTPEPRQG